MQPEPPSGPDDRPVDGVITLEFWPDHGHGPLWTADGKPVVLTSLELPPGLAQEVAAWHAAYDEDKVPIDGAGDEAWLREGVRLLAGVRAALGPTYRVVVTEPWWDESPT